MSLSIKGKLTQKLAVEEGTSKAGKEWRKGSFVIDTGNEYNPLVCFSLFGEDKLSMLDAYKEGQEIEVSFNVSSREFNSKYYHNLDAWKISPIGTVNNAPVGVEPSPENDDLPF